MISPRDRMAITLLNSVLNFVCVCLNCHCCAKTFNWYFFNLFDVTGSCQPLQSLGNDNKYPIVSHANICMWGWGGNQFLFVWGRYEKLLTRSVSSWFSTPACFLIQVQVNSLIILYLFLQITWSLCSFQGLSFGLGQCKYDTASTWKRLVCEK